MGQVHLCQSGDPSTQLSRSQIHTCLHLKEFHFPRTPQALSGGSRQSPGVPLQPDVVQEDSWDAPKDARHLLLKQSRSRGHKEDGCSSKALSEFLV